MGKPVEEQLAELIADAAVRRQRGEPVVPRADDAARMVMELGADGDDEAFERFFARLAAALKERGASLPPLDELPPSMAPLIAGFGQAFAMDADGAVDFEETAAGADRMMRKALGTSPRQVREARMRAKIRSEVEVKVAASLRRHGLVPACDVPVDDDPESTE